MAWRQDGFVPPAAFWLGHAGLVPFAAGAVAAWTFPGGQSLLIAYGAAILAFMGGCRWGFAAAGLGEGPGWIPLAVSVLPSLWAALALAVPGRIACLMLAAGFVVLLAADLALARRGGAPVWWPRLRWPLSLGATAALLAGAAS